jgi:hypothetical protein
LAFRPDIAWKTDVIDEKRFGVRKESLALLLAIAASLAACGDVATGPIGPVDHECHGNPTRSEGSGCDKRRLLGESDGRAASEHGVITVTVHETSLSLARHTFVTEPSLGPVRLHVMKVADGFGPALRAELQPNGG